MNKNLLGVVVCGGQSKRMGSDKGLLLIDSKTWSEHVSEKIKAAGIPVVMSINAGQEEAYKKLFFGDDLIVDHFDLGGPMNGLLSVHRKFPEQDILFMACDMIEMEQTIIRDIVDAYEKNKAFDFYAYEVERVVQPFCAIYTAKALENMLYKLEQQSLASSSMRYTLENGNTYRMSTPDSFSFVNYNTLDERKK